MCKRAMLMLLALMTVPSFAGATTYWAITATTSPAAMKTSLTAARPANFGNYTTPGGATKNLTNVTKSSLGSVSFDVAAVAGYTVKVKVDGVQVATAPGTVTVTKNTVLNRSIVATYSAASYVISTIPANGGTITGSVTAPASTSPSVTIAALPGYSISGAKIDGTVYAVADPLPAGVSKVGGVYTFASVSAPHSIQGVFAVVPVVTPLISNGAAVTLAPSGSIVLDGSSSVSNVAGTTYAWTNSCGTLTAVVPADPKKVTFTAPATLNTSCVATLTLTAAGVTPNRSASIAITTGNPKHTQIQICLDCHNGTDGPSETAFQASTAHMDRNSCQDCHNPAGALSHPYSTPTGTFYCASCHSSATAEFQGSIHWTTTANAGYHRPVEPTDPGLSCIYRCHFKATDYVPGSVPGDNTVGTGYACSTCHGGTLASNGSVIAPGAAPHKVLVATAANTCYICHSGGKHGLPTNNYKLSTHYLGTYAIMEGVNLEGCVACHNAHSTEATFTGSGGATEGCQKCHTPGSPYSIYNANMTLKAPHGGGVATNSVGGNGTTQFVTQGNLCSDCHSHNSSINKGYAESGHGKVSSDPMNAWGHYDWTGRTNDGSRLNGNCGRCHTSYGFIKFANQTTGFTRLRPVSGQPNSVLNCMACHITPTDGVAHKALPEGALRTNAIPNGNRTALTGGYFALFSSSVANLGAGKTKTEVYIPGYKNSSICVPCHSGRTTDVYVKNYVATIGNYSTLQLSNYQHAANMAQTFVGKGGWDFGAGTLKNFSSAANQTPHTTIKMGSADKQGPCVGCHYSSTGVTHSLEVNYTSATCTPCHGAAGPQLAKFAEFSSARFALDTLVRAKMAPLNASGSTDLNVERGGYFRYGRFGKAAGVAADRTTAANAYGAVYNWQLLRVWDANAWAHNPAYARQILNDTLTYLNSDGAVTASTPATVAAAITAANAIKAVDQAKANAFANGNTDPNALCISCHAVGRNAGAGYVQDNNGVRAITAEFSKWSHHVTGVALQDAHCAACHMEGKVVGGKIAVDTTYHMKDAKTYLRNADSDAPMAWDPEAPDHSTMDNFCMSCHDANGATSTQSAAIRGVMIPAVGKTASAKNPFGDTISNRYDKMQRPAVTNVDSQFNTTNNSHHGVKGARYTGRTRVAGPRVIASPSTFANNSSALLQGKRSTMYDAGNLNQLYTPLENAGGEAAPRTGAATLGDDSTLHCGDCHTVGQWKVASSETANGSPTPAVIGAHGSNNEYMLRNSIGTDQRHTQNAFLQGNITGSVLNPTTGLPIPNGVIVYTNPDGAFLVCYNCHAYKNYGSIYLANGNNGSHAGEYDASGRCNGIGDTIPFNGYTTGSKTDGTQFASRFMGPITKYSSAAPYAGEQNAEFGNIFGIQCLNCHNSGLGNAYGGIHGSANNTEWNNGTTVIEPDPSVTGGAYIDGMGNTTKHQRFLPGLGNAMYVPGTLGGISGGTTITPTGQSYTITTGGISNDTNWEQKWGSQVLGTVIPNLGTPTGPSASVGAGCYTLGGATAEANNQRGPSVTGEGVQPETEALDIWGGCEDHGGVKGKGTSALKRIVRPVTY
jgi:hypothetical protein